MNRISTFTFVVFLLFLTNLIFAQPTLKPSIGVGTLPNDSDPICTFPVFTGSYNASGYAIGDTIPDFTLYTLAGNPVNMQTVLGQGKPVLLVGGNLTCPVFRGKIATINNMASLYAGFLDIYIIYGMEAHPTTPSPYSGAVWITSSNQSAGILFPQPTTYGERKNLVDTLLYYTTINVPILIDGPCNEWLSNFGPAPNNAYLINTNGVIYEKQGWFHKLPDDMYCELDSMLGTNFGQCNAAGNNGTFSFSYVNDTIEYGSPGDVLGVHATLTNNSNTDNVVIEIIRLQTYLPSTWQTAMCLDVCLGTNIDTTQLIIPPSGTQDFIFYFYTNPNVDSIGFARVAFSNVNNSQNKLNRRFWGKTDGKATNIVRTEEKTTVDFYPNPSDGIVYFRNTVPVQGSIQIMDLNGRVVQCLGEKNWSSGDGINCGGLSSSGVYVIQLITKDVIISKKIILK